MVSTFEKKLQSIKTASRLTEKIFQKTIRHFGSFSTELEVQEYILSEMKKIGKKPSFSPIVGSAKGGSEPHHKPSLPLTKGFCVIDLGLKVSGYCSDLTRTIYLGDPAPKDYYFYGLVKNAQTVGARELKHGAACLKPYFAAKNMLRPYEKNFIHGLGHGLGKRIHTKPFMKKKSVDILKEGDIVTIEPGIYFKGKFGIRIEDDYLVTKQGAQQLTNLTKELIILPKP